ncbi:MAG TPA: hypothetical protein VGK71_02730 [Nitrospirota bacterium]|jgi:hypothetical protein
MFTRLSQASAVKGIVLAAIIILLSCQAALCADGSANLSSHTGNLLRGTVYKYTGVSREGIITIRTTSKLLAVAPVCRYDFDILNATMEGTLYNFMMADIESIEFLPMEEGTQPVNLLLRNGTMRKVLLTSGNKGIFGKFNLRVKEVDIVTEGYGENIVPGGDIQKIVFTAQKPAEDNIKYLVDQLGYALEVGRRDDLIDNDFRGILENIQSRMRTKINEKK